MGIANREGARSFATAWTCSQEVVVVVVVVVIEVVIVVVVVVVAVAVVVVVKVVVVVVGLYRHPRDWLLVTSILKQSIEFMLNCLIWSENYCYLNDREKISLVSLMYSHVLGIVR